MALTKGFKNLVATVAVIAIVGGGGMYTHKHNYFGMLEEKQKVEAPTAIPPVPPVEQAQPAAVEEPIEVVTPRHQKHKHNAAAEADAPPEEAPAPAPSNNSAIDKLKGLNSL